MYMPNRSSSAYQLDMYIERKPDKKAEHEKIRQRKARAVKRKLTLYMAVFFAAMFIMLFRYVRIYDLHNSINTQTAKLEEISTDNEHTKLKIESLTDKTKIQEYAENQLGLKKVTTAQIVYLDSANDNYMKNVAKSNSKSSAVKGIFAGFLEYLK